MAEGGECHTKMPVEIPVEDLDYAKHRYEQKESNSSPVVSESTWRPRLSNIETIMQMEDDDYPAARSDHSRGPANRSDRRNSRVLASPKLLDIAFFYKTHGNLKA